MSNTHENEKQLEARLSDIAFTVEQTKSGAITQEQFQAGLNKALEDGIPKEAIREKLLSLGVKINEREPKILTGEEIQTSLEKLHKELEINPRFTDIISNFVEAGKRLKERVEAVQKGEPVPEFTGDKKGTKPNEGVTVEDIQIERDLETLIKRFEDGSYFFSEEENTELPPEDAESVWVCDPVSNTKSLREGKPGYAITIAHRQGKETDFAAVYDVARGRMYTAYRGKGAYMNGEKMQAPKASIEKPRISIGKGNTESNQQLSLSKQLKGELFTKKEFIKAEGKDGSIALRTLESVSGEREGAVIFAKDIFPHVASQLIVEEAGGEFTNLHGEKNIAYTDDLFIIGANKELHGEMLNATQSAAKDNGMDVG